MKSSLGHALVSIVFLAMAALQLNDPDPLLWVTVYLCVAVMPIARALGHRLHGAFWVTSGIAFACLIISLPGFIEYLRLEDFASLGDEMSTEKPHIESAREFLGVAIAAVCLFFYRGWHVKTRDAQ